MGESSFSPNSKILAVGTHAGTTLFDLTRRSEIRVLPSDESVMSVGFTPDGRYVGWASWDRAAHVWDLTAQREEAQLFHDSELWGIAFSPDGRHVATHGMSNAARVWLFRTEDLVSEVCARVTRSMTYAEWKEFIGDRPLTATCPRVPLDGRELALQAASFVSRGQGKQAEASFQTAARLVVDARDAGRANSVCWLGAIWGFAELVLPACELAVELSPRDVNYRDSRGVALAMLGDFRRSIDDFESYVQDGAPAYIPERRQWIELLRKGTNPLDDATLKRLRRQ